MRSPREKVKLMPTILNFIRLRAVPIGLVFVVLVVSWGIGQIYRPASNSPAQTAKSGHQPDVRASEVKDLPAFSAAAANQPKWDGVNGLAVERVKASEIVPGQAALRLTAASIDGLHRIGIMFRGLKRGHAYRATAWLKDPKDSFLVLDVRDGGNGGGGSNHGNARFDLDRIKSEGATGGIKKTGIAVDKNGWIKPWVDLVTNNGELFVYVTITRKKFVAVYRPERERSLELGGVTLQEVQRQ